MMRYLYILCVMGMTLLPLCPGQAQAQPASAATSQPMGAVAFPAAGLIDLDEGTLEFWINFGFDPQEKHEGWRGRASVLWLDFGDAAYPADGWSIKIGTRPLAQGPQRGEAMAPMVRFGITANGEEFPHPYIVPFGLQSQRNQWQHFALIYSKRRVQTFIDGQAAEEMRYAADPPSTMTSLARLGLGFDPAAPRLAADNPVAIDDLRISSIARKSEELGFAAGKLTADRHTLLLLNFDNEDNRIVPAAPVNSTLPAASLAEGWCWIEGKFGRALAMSSQAFAPTGKTPASAAHP